jgi:hypothetical protein
MKNVNEGAPTTSENTAKHPKQPENTPNPTHEAIQ